MRVRRSPDAVKDKLAVLGSMYRTFYVFKSAASLHLLMKFWQVTGLVFCFFTVVFWYWRLTEEVKMLPNSVS